MYCTETQVNKLYRLQGSLLHWRDLTTYRTSTFTWSFSGADETLTFVTLIKLSGQLLIVKSRASVIEFIECHHFLKLRGSQTFHVKHYLIQYLKFQVPSGLDPSSNLNFFCRKLFCHWSAFNKDLVWASQNVSLLSFTSFRIGHFSHINLALRMIGHRK